MFLTLPIASSLTELRPQPQQTTMMMSLTSSRKLTICRHTLTITTRTEGRPLPCTEDRLSSAVDLFKGKKNNTNWLCLSRLLSFRKGRICFLSHFKFKFLHVDILKILL